MTSAGRQFYQKFNFLIHFHLDTLETFIQKVLFCILITLVAFIAYIMLEVRLIHSDKDIKKTRKMILNKEAKIAVGGDIDLNVNENRVNACLMKHKLYEAKCAFENPKEFLFAQHYFSYKDRIQNSIVYKIIKDMPKGAVLHIHDMGILGADYLMNLTYLDHLYLFKNNDTVRFKFSDKVPNESYGWVLVSEAREMSGNVEEFDANLRKHFTLVVKNPDTAYPSINDTWNAFMNFFFTVEPLITYKPVWEQYFYDALLEFRKEKILYVEVRSILPKLYDLDGTNYHPLVTAMCYNKVIKRFVEQYPDFIGAKLIYAPIRHADLDTLNEYLNVAKLIQKEMPELFAGFDLVGQEDLGGPLVEFLPKLCNIKNMNLFFHAGETNWYGFHSDKNLVDAILLGAKRLGHAFALPKHPLLLEEVIKRDIGIEVNVISNTVLSLVRDVRNHPLSTFLALGVPVVLSSDDPGVWEADIISHDYYVAFAGAAHKYADLKVLKALALNSIKYSALNHDEKDNAFQEFYKQWNRFVDNFDCSKYL